MSVIDGVAMPCEGHLEEASPCRCRSSKMALAPPPLLKRPSYGPSGKAYLIHASDKTPFGWHAKQGSSQFTQSSVMAFRKQQDAMHICSLLGRFRKQHNEWPDLVIEAAPSIELLLQPPPGSSGSSVPAGDIHHALSVEQIALDTDYIDYLAVNNVVLEVVQEIEGNTICSSVFRFKDIPCDVFRANLAKLYAKS